MEAALQPDTVISQTEAAQRLGVSRQTLWAWRTAGKGPKVVMIGERPQYLAEDVEAHAAQRITAGRRDRTTD